MDSPLHLIMTNADAEMQNKLVINLYGNFILHHLQYEYVRGKLLYAHFVYLLLIETKEFNQPAEISCSSCGQRKPNTV